jgi:hypothetical protein
MKIHPFIFCWQGQTDKALYLEQVFLKIFGKVTVINSGENSKRKNWIDIGNDAYFAEQFSTACDLFNGDIMLHVQADVSFEDWRSVINSAIKYYKVYNFGIYAPNIDYTSYTSDYVDISNATPDGTLKNVLLTDCSAWFINKSIISFFKKNYLKNYLKTKYGWGICACLSCISYLQNKPVLRDYNFKLSHPKSTNYPKYDAKKLGQDFLKTFDAQLTEYFFLLNRFLYKNN